MWAAAQSWRPCEECRVVRWKGDDRRNESAFSLMEPTPASVRKSVGNLKMSNEAPPRFEELSMQTANTQRRLAINACLTASKWLGRTQAMAVRATAQRVRKVGILERVDARATAEAEAIRGRIWAVRNTCRPKPSHQQYLWDRAALTLLFHRSG